MNSLFQHHRAGTHSTITDFISLAAPSCPSPLLLPPQAYVSAGRFTAFWELDLSSWDIAAGALLVAEAGGRVTDTRGAPYSLLTRDVFASNGAGAVHEGALAALAAVRADRLSEEVE